MTIKAYIACPINYIDINWVAFPSDISTFSKYYDFDVTDTWQFYNYAGSTTRYLNELFSL